MLREELGCYSQDLAGPGLRDFLQPGARPKTQQHIAEGSRVLLVCLWTVVRLGLWEVNLCACANSCRLNHCPVGKLEE